ncbi:MAG: hydroxymethylbilane synthase [Verrucomicrobiota bacterium]|nr:hydroxymethylbilane synthase [Verrucomicrobiota bacterium]
MRAPNTIVLGSRGSALARTQVGLVDHALRIERPDLAMRVEIIITRGDEERAANEQPIDRKAGRKGMFTSEIERTLLAGEIDVAVHSAKDLPSEQAAGLQIGAVLPRAAVDDILMTKIASGLAALPPNAVVATGSVRREYQLRAVCPDFQIVDLRGNVPTRIRKLGQNSWDAIVLARAGLERLGFDVASGVIEFEEASYHCHTLSSPDFVSAGGQGIVALQVRSDDAETVRAVRAVNDAETLTCLAAEREFLRQLDGDCDSPVGVLATIRDRRISMRAQVFHPPSTKALHAEVEAVAEGVDIGRLATELMEKLNGG